MLGGLSFFFTLGVISSPLKITVTLDQKPLAGQPIQVIGFTQGEQKFEKTEKTGADGRLQVSIPNSNELHLLVQTIYQNVAYYSNILEATELPKEGVQIKVYPAVAEDAAVRVEDLRLFFKETDAGLRVDEEIVIQNASEKTITGKNSDPKSEEAPETFRLQLPNGAFDLKFESGFTQETTRFENNDIILARPLLPGRARLGLQYTIERGRRSLAFQQILSLPVTQISFGTESETLKIYGLDLKAGPQKWIDEGQAYTWTYLAPTPLKKIAFEIRGLKLNYRAAEVIAPLTLFLLILSLILMNRFLKSDLKASELSSQASRQDLEEWRRIHELLKAGVINIEEAQKRKMKSLEKLIPRMNNQNKGPSV